MTHSFPTRRSSDLQEDREATGRQKAINDELEWIRAGTKGRQTKSKARIKKFEELVASQESRTPGKAQIVIQVPERLGGKVIEADRKSTRLNSITNAHLVCRLLLEKKKKQKN